MLLGHSDSYVRDKVMQVTIAYNHFGEGLIQRMPRLVLCRKILFQSVFSFQELIFFQLCVVVLTRWMNYYYAGVDMGISTW